MNLRDVKRRDKIIVKRREELKALELQLEQRKKRERLQQEAEDKRQKERDKLRKTRDEYNGFVDDGMVGKYAQMLLNNEDDWEMRDMKLKAIMEVMKGFRS